MTESADADVRLVGHMKSFTEGLAVTRERAERARMAWITADWRRLKAIEDGATERVAFLTAAARAARREYDEALAYHGERLAGAASYIRTEVRDV